MNAVMELETGITRPKGPQSLWFVIPVSVVILIGLVLASAVSVYFTYKGLLISTDNSQVALAGSIALSIAIAVSSVIFGTIRLTRTSAKSSEKSSEKSSGLSEKSSGLSESSESFTRRLSAKLSAFFLLVLLTGVSVSLNLSGTFFTQRVNNSDSLDSLIERNTDVLGTRFDTVQNDKRDAITRTEKKLNRLLSERAGYQRNLDENHRPSHNRDQMKRVTKEIKSVQNQLDIYTNSLATLNSKYTQEAEELDKPDDDLVPDLRPLAAGVAGLIGDLVAAILGILLGGLLTGRSNRLSEQFEWKNRVTQASLTQQIESLNESLNHSLNECHSLTQKVTQMENQLSDREATHSTELHELNEQLIEATGQVAVLKQKLKAQEEISKKLFTEGKKVAVESLAEKEQAVVDGQGEWEVETITRYIKGLDAEEEVSINRLCEALGKQSPEFKRGCADTCDSLLEEGFLRKYRRHYKRTEIKSLNVVRIRNKS